MEVSSTLPEPSRAFQTARASWLLRVFELLYKVSSTRPRLPKFHLQQQTRTELQLKLCTALLAHTDMAMAVMAPLKHQRYVSKKERSLVPVRFQTRKLKRKRRVPRTVPRAPFNDSSFLMRVRRAGGLASSPSSVFPSSVAYRDFLDHEDYGYGSMAGFLRLRDTEEGGDGVLDDVGLEERVDRFEMMDLGAPPQQEARRIRHLEDENLALKDRLFLVQQEVDELRDRSRGNESPQSCLES